MKIQKLKVNGFRSLKSIEWSPGDLNVIIGPNGSGKSNLLRSLELISAAAGGRLREYIKRENGIDSILWDGIANSIYIDLSTSPIFLPIRRIEFNGNFSLEYELELYSIYTKQETYHTIEALTATQKAHEKDKGAKYQLIKAGEANDYVLFDGFEEEVSGVTPSAAGETILSDLKSSIDLRHIISAYPQDISNWRFYHHLRTDTDSPIRQPVITRFDPSIEPDGSNLISVLHTLYTGNRDFENNIDKAMKSAFGNDFDKLVFPPASDQKIQLRIRWKSLKREVSSLDISDGTLRFLFLITILANPQLPSLVVIDEPETGLHPAMLPIIADFAVDASTRSQVIISTHSADFLDAFHDITPTTTVMECVNGETVLKILKKNKLKSWLEDYTLGELFRMRQLEDMQ